MESNVCTANAFDIYISYLSRNAEKRIMFIFAKALYGYV